MDAQPELIADYRCVTGEGPLWHPQERRLYWVDIPQGRMFRYDPATGQHEQCYQGRPIGGFTIQADGALLLFMDRGTVKIWREGQLTTLIEEIPDERETRFNDVIADPAGRVFCGTMRTLDRLGRLYRLDLDGTLTLVLDDITCSNGMGFTLDRKQMYYTDTRRYEIYRFDYDQETGQIANRRLFVRVPEGEGAPDGMTVDAEGHVWSARWDGGRLVRYAPDGAQVARIDFPARKVSSVTFGGPDYADMFVTTAGGDNKEEDGPGAGGLFYLRPGVRGLPEFYSRVGL
jgi:D-xylonolactonase